MNKNIYSEEELEQLFQNLFLEKKKVKDLEQKLEILHQDHQLLLLESKQFKDTPSSQTYESGEIEKLKDMLVSYKKKSAQAIHALYENEHQKIKQETLLAHQLRQFQASVEELKEENRALLEQQKLLRERHDQSESKLKKNLEQLQLAQSRFQECSQDLCKTQGEKQEVFNELQVLQGQFAVLRAKVIEGQDTIKSLNQEKLQLEVHLADKTRLFKRIEEEVSTIKQSLSNGKSDVKDIEERYLSVVNEKAALYNKSANLEHLLERHRSEIGILQQKLEDATKKEDTFKLQLEEAEGELEERHQGHLHELQKRIRDLETSLQKHHVLLQEKERILEENSSQIIQLMQEKLRVEDTLSNSSRYHDEQDTRLKIAQQHLGKKVKEVTLMNERLDEQRVLITDLQSSLNQLRGKTAEMQSSFELQLQQEKNRHEHLQETIRVTESKAAQWEEKYTKTHEKLKVLEEKQNQMQVLFTGLGNVMGTPSMSLPSPITQTSMKNALHLVDTQNIPHSKFEERYQEESALKSTIQPSLFDLEKPHLKIRQNLFE